MTALARLLDLLPPPWTQAPDSVLAALLDIGALEIESGQEDVDRLRRTHWFDTTYRLIDAEKLAALVGVERLPWERDLVGFRHRARALIDARLRGALGAETLRHFVYDYVSRVQESLHASLVPGLPPATRWQEAFEPVAPDQLHRRLGFEEWPAVRRRSPALAAVSGRVPYLFSWTERNGGLDPATPRLMITGLMESRTAVPVIVNLTTGELVGWAGVVGTGRRLVITRRTDDGAGPRDARAFLDDEVSGFIEVSDRLFSLSNFEPGRPFTTEDLDETPRTIHLERGDNDLRYLSVGLHDVDGLDHVFFAIASADLREGVFDETAFDRSLFPSGLAAVLGMEWTERSPATFRVRVPRAVVIEDRSVTGGGELDEVHSALRLSIEQLKAAGVRAEMELVALRERQPHDARVRMPWIRVRPQIAPSGEGESLEFGGRFGESALDGSRFE